MDTKYWVDALQEALRAHEAAASAWTRMDNGFAERPWRPVKYEEVYLHAYQDGREAREGIVKYLRFYNTQRPHQALGYTPSKLRSTLLPPSLFPATAMRQAETASWPL